MTFDEFIEIYKPVKNPFRISQINEYHFETIGEEFYFVKEQKPERIWSFVKDNNDFYIVTGFTIKNVFGYLITGEKYTKYIKFKV